MYSVSTIFLIYTIIIHINTVFSRDCKVKLGASSPLVSGGMLELTCDVRLHIDTPGRSHTISVEFLHNTKTIIPQCQQPESRYCLSSCPNKLIVQPHENLPDGIKENRFVLQVHNLTWLDRGQWGCYCLDNAGIVSVQEIAVPGTLQPMQMQLVVNSTPFNELETIPRPNLQPKTQNKKPITVKQKVKEPLHSVSGLGTEEMPLNLTHMTSLGVDFWCHLSCSYPMGYFSWKVSSHHSKVAYLPSAQTTVSSTGTKIVQSFWDNVPCSKEATTRDQYFSSSRLHFQCADLLQKMANSTPNTTDDSNPFRGVLRISCGTKGVYNGQQSKDTFVICWDEPPKNSFSLLEFVSRLEFFLIATLVGCSLLIVCTCCCLCICDYRNTHHADGRGTTSRRTGGRYSTQVEEHSEGSKRSLPSTLKVHTGPRGEAISMVTRDESLCSTITRATSSSRTNSLPGPLRTKKVDHSPQIVFV